MNNNELPFPVSAIEFEKVYMVMERRIALGYSDRELSFLLGYRALYVRDVENPLHTLRYTPKDTNYLLDIFGCKLADIMPPKVSALFYQIKVSVVSDPDGSLTYEIFKEVSKKKFSPYRIVNSIDTGMSVKSDVQAGLVLRYVDGLFSSDYFQEPKTALEIFKKCVQKFGKKLSPKFVLDALSFYTGKRKSPKLFQEKNASGRTVYKKG